MAEWFVAKAAEMSDGDRRIVTAGRHEIGVFFKDGAYYAYSNYCLHAGGPACEGLMINRVVDLIGPDRTYLGQAFADEMHFVCPWHGWEYDVTTGECAGDRKLGAAPLRCGPPRRRRLRRGAEHDPDGQSRLDAVAGLLPAMTNSRAQRARSAPVLPMG